MNKVNDIIIAVLLTGALASAQQVNIFGKVVDSKGGALDSVAVRLARYPAIADTTGKSGLFSLTGQISAVIAGIVPGKMPPIRYAGGSLYFAVDRPMRIAVDLFTIAGRRLATPLDETVIPGMYRLPVAAAFAKQIVCVRVTRGNDVRVFRMQGLTPGRASEGAMARLARTLDSSYARISKISATPVDTLVFSRNGFVTHTLAILSYTPGDSIRASLLSDTDQTAGLKAKVAAAANSIKLEVQNFRGKNYVRAIAVSVYTRSQYTAIVGKQIDTIPRSAKDFYNNVLRLEGLLRPNQDYFSPSDTAIAQGTAGFYVPGTDSLYVILADTATGLMFEDSLTIFHELVHALQDQNFNLTAIVDSTAPSDQYYAGHYVIEGEAELLMDYYAFKLSDGTYPTSATPVVNYLNREQTAVDADLDSQHAAGEPLIASMPFIWEYYSYGPKFISAIAGMHWPVIDTVIFHKFPGRMFEVLHPQKYPPAAEYVLDVRNLENFLVSYDSIVDEDELGELLSDVMFREWDFSPYQNIPDGMTADRIIVCKSPQADSLRMIWNTSWQDSSAAASFFVNYARLVEKKRNIRLPAPVNSGVYSSINDTLRRIYIEHSKNYVFTLENYRKSTLNESIAQCRAVKPAGFALAKSAAGQTPQQPRIGKHRQPGGGLHPFRGEQDGLR